MTRRADYKSMIIVTTLAAMVVPCSGVSTGQTWVKYNLKVFRIHIPNT